MPGTELSMFKYGQCDFQINYDYFVRHMFAMYN